ncbi:MAG TPA: hypothetical protein VF226_07315 [Hyphomicrobiaceae bacterium]
MRQRIPLSLEPARNCSYLADATEWHQNRRIGEHASISEPDDVIRTFKVVSVT